MRSTSGLEGTPPGVLTLTGSDRVPSPFLVSAATWMIDSIGLIGSKGSSGFIGSIYALGSIGLFHLRPTSDGNQ